MARLREVREIRKIKKMKKDFHIKAVLIRRLPSQYAHSQWPERPWEVPEIKKIKKDFHIKAVLIIRLPSQYAHSPPVASQAPGGPGN